MHAAGSVKDRGKPSDAQAASNGQAQSDIPALKPYWGKPAVRNFREGHGNVGIIRSPLRAIALPDPSLGGQYSIYEDIGSVKQENLRKAHKKLRNAHTSPADGENRTIVHLLDAFTLHRPKAPV